MKACELVNCYVFKLRPAWFIRHFVSDDALCLAKNGVLGGVLFELSGSSRTIFQYSKVLWKYFYLIVGLMACSFVFACDEGDLQIEIEGFGVLSFINLDSSPQDGVLLLSGGVCVAGVSGWQIGTESLRVELQDFAVIDEDFAITSDAVVVMIEGWQLEASAMYASLDQLLLENLTFHGGGVSGSARSARYQVSSGLLTLQEAQVVGRNLNIQGQEVILESDNLRFLQAAVTTCNCENGPFYLVRGEEFRFNLLNQRLEVKAGVLELAGLSFELGDTELSEESLAEFSVPLTIEYRPADPASGVEGTGLGVRIPRLAAAENLSFELALLGLDVDFPLRTVVLLKYDDGDRQFTIGSAALGPQADISIRQELSSTTSLRFGMQNRHWASQDFLHEGFLQLDTSHSFRLSQHRLTVSAQLLTAISSQTFNRLEVLGSRIGTLGVLSYQAPTNSLGRFTASISGRLSYYPQQDTWQYGLRLQPRWRHNVGPLELDVTYLQEWTNSASPFSLRLDRLEPRSELSLVTRLAAELSPSWVAELGLNSVIDFLPLARGAVPLTKRFRVDASLLYRHSELELKILVLADLADTINGNSSGKSFVETGFDIVGSNWETGLRLRLQPGATDYLQKLELRLSFPLDYPGYQLKPFLALDFVPTLGARDWPRLSGHGLELSLYTCCGTFIVAYRQVDNRFNTSLSIRFDDLE